MSPDCEQDLSVERRQASKACDQCSRRKTRCDQLRPSCSACRVRNLACTFSHKKKPGPPKGYKRHALAQAKTNLDSHSIGSCQDTHFEEHGRALEVLTPNNPAFQLCEPFLDQDTWLDGFLTEELWSLPESLPREESQPDAPNIESPPELDVDLKYQLVTAYLLISSPLFPTFAKSKLIHLFKTNPDHMTFDAICAVSVHFARSTNIKHHDVLEAAPSLATRAHRRLEKEMQDLQYPDVSLDSIKVSLLLTIYATFCDASADSDFSLRKTVSLAHKFGLDKVDSPLWARFQILTSDEREDCRRLWWCIYELDGFCAWQNSRPPLVDLPKALTSLPSSSFKDLMQPAAIPEALIIFPTDTSQALTELAQINRPSMTCEQMYMLCVTLARETFSRLSDLQGVCDAVDIQLPLIEDSIASFRLLVPDELRLKPKASIWSRCDDSDQRYFSEGLLLIEMVAICLHMVKCALNTDILPLVENELHDRWTKCMLSAFSILDIIRDLPPKIVEMLNPQTSGIIYLAVACCMLESKLDPDPRKKNRLAHRILLGRRALSRVAQLWSVAKFFQDRNANLEASIATVTSLGDIRNILRIWTGFGAAVQDLKEIYFTFPFATLGPWTVNDELTP